MDEIFEEVEIEIQNQINKWGEQNHPCLDQVLLNREGSCTPEQMCEEYEIPTENRAKQMCDISLKRGTGTYAHIAVEEMSEVVSAFDIHKRREELIQLTAVCVSWIRKIDRDISATTQPNEDLQKPSEELDKKYAIRDFISELRKNWIPKTKDDYSFNSDGEKRHYTVFFDEYRTEWTTEDRAFQGYVINYLNKQFC